MSKKCSSCKEVKHYSQFAKNKSSKDGYQNTCKLCQESYRKSQGIISKEDAEKFVSDLTQKGRSFTCKTCGDSKIANEFYYKRAHGKVTINSSKCKECQKQYQRTKTFGVTEQDYQQMLDSQGNQCAICKVDHSTYIASSHRGKKFAVDHCHTTLKIRGLLCDKCNRGLGFFQDNEVHLLDAIKYLKG